jgi:hypothetical protein
MSRDTTVADRMQAIDAAFEEAPRAQLPAEVQQMVMDERPRGAVSVAVRRDEREIFQKIKTIATAAGDDFFYSWPTKNKDGTKGEVAGPSVKCANAVARLFGNCSVKVRVFDMGANWIFYAQFYDLETGFVLERPFQQRKGQNVGGGMDKDRATDIVFQIGTSKAARNVVCNALSEFTDFAFAVAREQLVEKVGKNLDKFRNQVLERLATLKVDVKRVELTRGKTADKWLAGDVAKIIAEIQAVNDGMAHPDELWTPIDAAAQAGAPKPQPEDFQPKADGPATGKTAGQAAAAAAGTEGKASEPAQGSAGPGQQADAPAAATAAGAKTEPAQAAATGPQDGKPRESTEPAAAGKTETPLPPEQGGEQAHDPLTGELADGPSPAEKALEAAEAIVQRGIDNLANLRTPEDVDAQAPTIVEILKEVEDLDAEDLALLLNRWKTAQLERKREIGRRKGKR